MKKITVNGIEKIAALVIIPHWMDYKGVVAFLEGMGLQPGTNEDLRAYHAQYLEELKNRWTAAIGNSTEGKSLAYDTIFDSSKEGRFVMTSTEQQYLQGCSFLGISAHKWFGPVERYQPVIDEEKAFEVGGQTKTAALIPFSRWAEYREVMILLAETGCNLKVASLEDVKAYFTQHPEDLERKWESRARGLERPYAFLHETNFEDIFTSESEAGRSSWCATLVILPK